MDNTSDIVNRLKNRLQLGEPVSTKRAASDSFQARKKKKLPEIKPLAPTPQRSDVSKYSWVYHVLTEMKHGKKLADVLPKPVCPVSQAKKSETVELTNEDLARLESLMHKYVVENVDSRDMNEFEAPPSPGKEYDTQYINTSNTSNFNASVHEMLLNAQAMDSKDRQKLISCAKGIEKSLSKTKVKRKK